MSRSRNRATCADKLKVLSDPTRLSVVRELMAGPKSVAQLIHVLGLEQSLLSHHLQTLRSAGFVLARREGRSRSYYLASKIMSGAKNSINLGCCQLDFDQVAGTDRTARRSR